MLRRGNAFGRLIEGQVQRIPCRAGNHRIHRFLEPLQAGGLNKLHSGRMSLHRIARKHARNLPLLRQRHVQYEVVPRHACNLQQLRMQRIVFNRSLRRQRLAHEPGRVDHLDRLLRSQSRSDQLAPAAETQHQVLLNKAQRDVQVRRHKPLIDINRRPPPRRAQPAMLLEGPRIVAHHAILRRNLRPHNLPDLVFGRAPVQPRRNQDRDPSHRNPSLVQPFQ